ncbi:Bug family tripartite tricarboxylate transporter substrate binding protein [Falsiroseomonas stagni]|uniref:Tripartite-type tricarboxylate transporter, receptor component TctC n=1 Tax=Falsiroseomonas stagni DSM 19981 TaxID=1123062 RepID=A0A1I4AGC3_9PROT|nr:tripartite tricarboxylate transporter substrate binding protein [Falsiroseomonas stagni]SFK55077.1 Tripartite-type tricarboxylate transporter, receptor component TctC [Falsiroseomonas stagni DSM 19981]
MKRGCLLIGSLIGCLGWLAATLPAAAQTAPWPTRPLRLIVPFAPGATADLLGRMVGQRLNEELGQPVVVENRAGAGATLGSQVVAQAAPDGYTLLLSNAASQGTAPAMGRVPYDPVADFAHVALVGTIAQYLVVNPAVPARDLASFIALVRAHPGRYNLGTAGNGSIGHFAGALFMSRAQLDMVIVPYGGTAPATRDLLAGNVHAVFQNAPEAGPHVRDNRLRLLAVTGEAREEDFPQVPTFVEGGFPGFVNYTWYGLSAPRGTPDAVVQRLNAAMLRALATPAMRDTLRNIGVMAGHTTPAQYTAFVAAEVAKFTRLAQSTGIRAE